MLKIAYCDDSKQDRDRIMISICEIENKWGQQFEIDLFSSGKSLCEKLDEKYYDIILLDILIEDMSGIQIADFIKKNENDVLIIFISNYEDRMRELFDFRTIAFIDKPCKTDDLERALHRASVILNKEKDKFFCYCSNGLSVYIPIKEIIYFESKRNKVVIYTTKGVDSYYNTLLSVWNDLKDFNKFIMPHRSFVVNLKYAHVKFDKIIIKLNNQEINIGRKYSKDTRDRYIRFLDRRW